MSTLILLRHGQSQWNEKNLFTGWVDVESPFSAGQLAVHVAAGISTRAVPTGEGWTLTGHKRLIRIQGVVGV